MTENVQKQINICLSITSDKNNLEKILPLVYSIKKYTQESSKLNFYIFTNKVDNSNTNIKQFVTSLSKLSDFRTIFKIVDGSEYTTIINPTHNHFHTFFAYIKILLPFILPNLDRVMYLDWDTIVLNQGLEDFYYTDFEDNYIVATEDMSCVDNGKYIFHQPMYKQLKIFKYITSNYFNSGVMLFNIKKIIEDKFENKIIQVLRNEPPNSKNNNLLQQIKIKEGIYFPAVLTFQLTDQSILNYIFRDKIKIVSPIYNNMVRFMQVQTYKDWIQKHYGFKSFDQFLEKSVICHINSPKPWDIVQDKTQINKYILKAIQKYNIILDEVNKFLINKKEKIIQTKIDWSKYFDKIYCINFIEYKRRKQLLQFELNRVGILNSGIFDWHFTYNSKINKELEKYFYTLHSDTLQEWTNISLMFGHYECVRDAYFRGYNRVLILEDDIRFLRDLNKIEQYLDHRPNNSNIIMYDKFTTMDPKMIPFIPVNPYYSRIVRHYSGGCYQLDRKAMKVLLDLFQNKPSAVDNYFFWSEKYLANLNLYCSNINLAVQSFFKDAGNVTRCSLDIAKTWYESANINFDNYMMRKDGSKYNHGDYIE